MSTVSKAERIRDLLRQRKSYTEIKEALGCSNVYIAKVALEYERNGGDVYRPQNEPERVKRRLIRVMPKGGMEHLLTSLSIEELEALSRKSFTSWADAILIALRDTTDD